MTTPPPPPSSSGWPTPDDQPPPPGQHFAAGAPGRPDGARQTWWSPGRVIGAIVIVLVLMAGSATVGFLAGAAWSGAEAIGQDILDDINAEVAAGAGGGSGAAATDGDALRVGDTATGTFDEAPVEHDLTVETDREVTIELRSDDFDTVVRLLDGDGDQLAENDDIEFGQDRNSRVRLELPAGTYTVVVDAFGFDGGDYELSVS